MFPFRAGKPPQGLHLDVMKGDKLMEVTAVFPPSSMPFVNSSKRVGWDVREFNAPDTSLEVHSVPDVLHTGTFIGCMASNGARAEQP